VRAGAVLAGTGLAGTGLAGTGLAGTGLAGMLDGFRTAVVAPPGQARHHARDVGYRAVLAQLGLGLDPGNPQLQADDGAQLALDEGTRRVVHRPGGRLPG